MRLIKAQVTQYRSIRDTGIFDIDPKKAILVGPNEAGKTAVLQALQHINPPPGVAPLDPLRDYPRSEYNNVTKKLVDPAKVIVTRAWFTLEPDDVAAIPDEYKDVLYYRERRLDGEPAHTIEGGPSIPRVKDAEKQLRRIAASADKGFTEPVDPKKALGTPSERLDGLLKQWNDTTLIAGDVATEMEKWLDSIYANLPEGNDEEEKRYDTLKVLVRVDSQRDAVLATLSGRLPVFVLFNNYHRVRPLIHLAHLAERLRTKMLDDDQYDYGNQCLLKLLGFTAKELSDLGGASEPNANDPKSLKAYRDRLDHRSYQLNAASVALTEHIKQIWNPDQKRDEAARLKIVADGQYLKAVVEDDLGVEIELHQRSEGFQWLVSFFIVFFAEAQDKHKNAIVLLDEPGLSLHGLKQREFRETLSRLANTNQTIYSTHSPFLVGPDELDLVRVVEMSSRKIGTKVHTALTAGDPAGLLPLQEALGYDLAQTLFMKQRNLVIEGLTDYWYLDGVSEVLRAAGIVELNPKIALVPAASAGKVVYFATILHAQKLKVAALLDSDAAGDQAAKQDTLVHSLGNKRILRTKDAYSGPVAKPEMEDMLRETLVRVVLEELGVDVAANAAAQPNRSVLDIFAENVPDFSKYKMAKAFLRWTRSHEAADLTEGERADWSTLVSNVNKALD